MTTATARANKQQRIEKEISQMKGMLRHLEEWRNLPENEWEKQTAVDISKLPIVRVIQASDDECANMNMVHGECHKNAYWYAKLDPLQGHEHVYGWIRDQFNNSYVTHSIVRQKKTGIYFDITPKLRDVTWYYFSVDPALIWIEGSGLFRHGVRVPVGVRGNVAAWHEDANHAESIILKKLEQFNGNQFKRR